MYTPEFKAKLARYAIENGNCRAARKFSTILMKLLTRVLFKGGLQRTRGRWKGNEKLVRKFTAAQNKFFQVANPFGKFAPRENNPLYGSCVPLPGNVNIDV